MNIISAVFSAMGTRCEVVLVAHDEKKAQQAIEQVSNEVSRIEAKYSRYRADSVVTAINQAAGRQKPLEIDAETAWLLGFSTALYESSEGLFDLTTGKVSRAWDFQHKTIPSTTQLEELLTLVGWNNVELTSKTIYLPRIGMEIDLGGIGKEYAVDCAVNLLKKLGFSHGYVNFGGDIGVIGPQPDLSPWKIGIQNPRQPEEMIATVPLRGGALTTSGDYERFFEIDGVRYSHIIHPKTGMPVNFSRSVSVVAEEAIYAGSCSTVAMLMEKPESFLAKFPINFLIVAHDGSIKRG